MFYLLFTGDMEFKQNKFLPAERQIVTANPDINIVCLHEINSYCILVMTSLKFRSSTNLRTEKL